MHLDEPDDDSDAAQLLDEAGDNVDGSRCRGETGQQLVLARQGDLGNLVAQQITGERELRKNHEVGAGFRRPLDALQMEPEVGVQVAELG